MLFQLFCLCEWPGLFFSIICIHIFPDKESIRVSFFLTLKNTLSFKQTVQNTLSIWSGISALTETSLLPVLARMDTQCHRAHRLCLWAVQGYLGACSTRPTHSSGASRAQFLASHIHQRAVWMAGQDSWFLWTSTFAAPFQSSVKNTKQCNSSSSILAACYLRNTVLFFLMENIEMLVFQIRVETNHRK